MVEIAFASNRCGRFQFRLATLLVFITVANAALGCLCWKLRQKWSEREAVTAIRRRGGNVSYDWEDGWRSSPPSPAWARKFLGDDFFSHVVRVTFMPPASPNDDDLALLYRFGELQGLIIFRGGKCTDAGVEHIARLRALRNLAIFRAPITDVGISHLNALKQLRTLELPNNRNVTDTGLANLCGLTHLRGLVVTGTRVSSAGVAGLGNQLPRCKIRR